MRWTVSSATNQTIRKTNICLFQCLNLSFSGSILSTQTLNLSLLSCFIFTFQLLHFQHHSIYLKLIFHCQVPINQCVQVHFLSYHKRFQQLLKKLKLCKKEQLNGFLGNSTLAILTECTCRSSVTLIYFQ